jgi:hypothetical protein
MIYYLVLLFWFRKNQKDVKPINKIIPKKARTIIGKSTYIVSIPLEADQTTPENYAEPMQVDFEMEYDDDEELSIDLELEEIALLTNEDIKSAQGLSFEEMSQVVEVIQQEQTTEEKERQAAQTISLMQQTALFDIMIEQLDGGRQRVADMMSKYETGLVNNETESASTNELEEFDLGRYL